MISITFLRPAIAAVILAAVTSAGYASGIERTADVSGVAIKASPLNAQREGDPTLDFSVTMDTHSGNLPTDLAAIAFLRLPSGPAVPALSWTGGKGGHHLTGVLAFPSGMLRYEGPLTLAFRGSAGNDIALTWKDAFVAAAGFRRVTAGTGSYLDIPASVLAARLAHKDFFLANVHVPYEGEIDGTDAFIPYDKTEALLKDYPRDKGALIIVYCRSGAMSTEAARMLVRLGYTNVASLQGGMISWQAAGNALKESRKK